MWSIPPGIRLLEGLLRLLPRSCPSQDPRVLAVTVSVLGTLVEHGKMSTGRILHDKITLIDNDLAKALETKITF